MGNTFFIGTTKSGYFGIESVGTERNAAVEYKLDGIPTYATISSARIELVGATIGSGSFILTVMCCFQNKDNSNPWNNNFTTNLTSQFQIYVPSFVGNSTFTFNGLSSILQTVISRPGWDAGNSVTFLIKNYLNTPGIYGKVCGVVSSKLYVAWTNPVNPTISGTISRSTGGTLAGVPVAFTNPTSGTTTDSNGHYTKTVPYNWTGTVTPSSGSGTFYPVSFSFQSLTSSQTLNFLYTATPVNPTYSGWIINQITQMGESGVTVTFSGSGTTTSGADGFYSKQLTLGWSGTITPGYGTGSFSPASRSASNLAFDSTNNNFTWIPPPASPIISGYIRRNDLGTPLGGATITFDGGLGSTTSRESDGFYSMTVPYGWSGTSTASYSSGGFAYPSFTYTGLTGNAANQDFWWTPDPTISGTVIHYITGVPKQGITMTFSGVATVLTDTNGAYSQVVPYGWSGTATPSLDGVFSPSSVNYTNLVADTSYIYLWNPAAASNSIPAKNLVWTAFRPTISQRGESHIPVKNLAWTAHNPIRNIYFISCAALAWTAHNPTYKLGLQEITGNIFMNTIGERISLKFSTGADPAPLLLYNFGLDRITLGRRKTSSINATGNRISLKVKMSNGGEGLPFVIQYLGFTKDLLPYKDSTSVNIKGRHLSLNFAKILEGELAHLMTEAGEDISTEGWDFLTEESTEDPLPFRIYYAGIVKDIYGNQ